MCSRGTQKSCKSYGCNEPLYSLNQQKIIRWRKPVIEKGDKLKAGGIGSSDELEQNPIPHFIYPNIFGHHQS